MTRMFPFRTRGVLSRKRQRIFCCINDSGAQHREKEKGKVLEMKRFEISLKDKVALVTGAAGGLGGAIAWAFGAAGARVFLIDLLEEKLQDISQAMRAEGIDAGYQALEWAKYRILVNAIAPTFVETPFTAQMFQDEDFKKYVLASIPLGRMVTAEEIANAAIFLASDLSNMITGHILAVDGGWTIQEDKVNGNE